MGEVFLRDWEIDDPNAPAMTFQEIAEQLRRDERRRITARQVEYWYQRAIRKLQRNAELRAHFFTPCDATEWRRFARRTE